MSPCTCENTNSLMFLEVNFLMFTSRHNWLKEGSFKVIRHVTQKSHASPGAYVCKLTFESLPTSNTCCSYRCIGAFFGSPYIIEDNTNSSVEIWSGILNYWSKICTVNYTWSLWYGTNRCVTSLSDKVKTKWWNNYSVLIEQQSTWYFYWKPQKRILRCI
jgi:hypothetical protein